VTDGGTVRPATDDDLDQVVETVALAFADDPVWGVALSRPDGRTDHHLAYWRLFVRGAHALDGIRLVGDAAAVSVWVPDGAAEMSQDLVEELLALNAEQLGPDGAADIDLLYERFDASRPSENHAYLSLLATHPAWRGRGIGQALLAHDLAGWDERGVPAYLESTNPANDHRYRRLGFRPIGSFTAVRDDAVVTAMWRDAGGVPD
jgi:GNAT superfamily N-acetyltransferase